ncbi:ABC transporter substrate-binding protein [Pararobbsia silviterrae]|uniref:ABC transporter substrate-binding protein n=1 Tax=Pararobbsia silviterrae TaxID=1792498 RepID=A0A494Y4H4_9BURK|nr:ABC transporter substrate-binding protein [Pararobbsia silviterrae]RKP57588.1 ABC transporter substrate-binding protein [Pararobbsia silviterrae]
MRRRSFVAASLAGFAEVSGLAGLAGLTLGPRLAWGDASVASSGSDRANARGADAHVADAHVADAHLPHPPRLVVLDWGLVETLLAIGVVPAGVSEIDDYNASVVSPVVPPEVPDVGLRLTPSIELIAELAPDLILINSSQESQRDLLERIAPVRAFDVYSDAGQPYRRSEDVTRALGALCHRDAAAQALIEGTRAALAADRARIASLDASVRDHPAYLIRFFDARHIGVYGAKSLFEDVFDALGVRNAWQGPTDYWGIGVAPLEALGAAATANLFYFEPLPNGGARKLADNRLWNALPAVAHARVRALPPFWGFGMLPSAQRFSRVITQALVSLAPAPAPAPTPASTSTSASDWDSTSDSNASPAVSTIGTALDDTRLNRRLTREVRS